jgi:hypothetical protein
VAQNLSDHRHRCGGLADAGKRESSTKCLDGWLSRPQTGPLPPLPRGRSGTQGTGSGQAAFRFRREAKQKSKPTTRPPPPPVGFRAARVLMGPAGMPLWVGAGWGLDPRAAGGRDVRCQGVVKSSFMLRTRHGLDTGSAANTGSFLTECLLEEQQGREPRRHVASPPPQ